MSALSSCSAKLHWNPATRVELDLGENPLSQSGTLQAPDLLMPGAYRQVVRMLSDSGRSGSFTAGRALDNLVLPMTGAALHSVRIPAKLAYVTMLRELSEPRSCGIRIGAALDDNHAAAIRRLTRAALSSSGFRKQM